MSLDRKIWIHRIQQMQQTPGSTVAKSQVLTDEATGGHSGDGHHTRNIGIPQNHLSASASV